MSICFGNTQLLPSDISFIDSAGKIYVLVEDVTSTSMWFAISSDGGTTWDISTSGSTGRARGAYCKYGTKIYFLHQTSTTQLSIKTFGLSDDASPYTWSSDSVVVTTGDSGFYSSGIGYSGSDRFCLSITSTGKMLAFYITKSADGLTTYFKYAYYNGSSWSVDNRLDNGSYGNYNNTVRYYNAVLCNDDDTMIAYYMYTRVSGYIGTVFQYINSSGTKSSPIQDGSQFDVELFHYTHESAERVAVIGLGVSDGVGYKAGYISDGGSSVVWDDIEEPDEYISSSYTSVCFTASDETVMIFHRKYSDSKWYRYSSVLFSGTWKSVLITTDYYDGYTCPISSTKTMVYWRKNSDGKIYAVLEPDPDIFITPSAITLKGSDLISTILWINKESYPTNDISLNGWMDPLYNSIDLRQYIDERFEDNTDFIQSPIDCNSQIYKAKLAPLTTPDTEEDTTLSFSYRKNNAYALPTNLKVRLLQNTTTIKELIYTGIATTWTTIDYVLSSSEQLSITDWTDLYIEVEAYQ